MKDKFNTLKKKIEEGKKGEKKNKITLKSVTFNIDKIIGETAEFLIQKLKIDVQIQDADKISNNIVLIKMQNWKEAMKIMRNKQNPKATEFYINNDTRKEKCS